MSADAAAFRTTIWVMNKMQSSALKLIATHAADPPGLPPAIAAPLHTAKITAMDASGFDCTVTGSADTNDGGGGTSRSTATVRVSFPRPLADVEGQAEKVFVELAATAAAAAGDKDAADYVGSRHTQLAGGDMTPAAARDRAARHGRARGSQGPLDGAQLQQFKELGFVILPALVG
eukprot:SAG11_NODE_13296_length_661_cov_1.097865_1_plen_175_part_01